MYAYASLPFVKQLWTMSFPFVFFAVRGKPPQEFPFRNGRTYVPYNLQLSNLLCRETCFQQMFLGWDFYRFYESHFGGKETARWPAGLHSCLTQPFCSPDAWTQPFCNWNVVTASIVADSIWDWDAFCTHPFCSRNAGDISILYLMFSWNLFLFDIF